MAGAIGGGLDGSRIWILLREDHWRRVPTMGSIDEANLSPRTPCSDRDKEGDEDRDKECVAQSHFLEEPPINVLKTRLDRLVE